MMQVSLNPLLSNIVSPQQLPAALTFGQFVKAVAALSALMIAGWFAVHNGNWRLLFAVFLIEGIIATVSLAAEKSEKKK